VEKVLAISFQARIKQLGVNIVNLKFLVAFLRVRKRLAGKIKRYYLDGPTAAYFFFIWHRISCKRLSALYQKSGGHSHARRVG
jgi:hypothetical protein